MATEDYDEAAERVKRQAAEQKQEAERGHGKLLKAVSEGEEFETHTYEWVEIGNVELRVKTWLPGDVMDRMVGMADALGVESVADLDDVDGFIDNFNLASVPESVDSILEVLSIMTAEIRYGDESIENDEEIRGFWHDFYGEHGETALDIAGDTVLAPAVDNDEVQEVVESFRSASGGEGLRGADSRRS